MKYGIGDVVFDEDFVFGLFVVVVVLYVVFGDSCVVEFFCS